MSITTKQGEQPMTMKNPPHPGGVVLRQCIEPLELTITDAAEALGVTRNTLSELVNEKRGISPEMAPKKAGLCNRRNTTLHRCAAAASSLSGLNSHS
jgi:addiction module HigA family antidote